MPSAIRYFAPQVTSSCILRPHSSLPASMNFLPYPAEPRKFMLKTAYPRFAKNCVYALYPQTSRPPWTTVRKDDCWQVPGRNTFGNRKIGWDHQSIRRLVAYRLHLRQGLPRKLLADPELKRKAAFLAVKQVRLRRFRVAVRDDQPGVFIVSDRGAAYILAT